MTGLGQGILLFLLWMCLLQKGHCNFYAHILWGQCYSFCLTRQEFRSHQKAAKDDIQLGKGLTIKQCRRDHICRKCVYVCQRPKNEYLEYASCLSDCEEFRGKGKKLKAQIEACEEACEFIRLSSQSKYGSCPKEDNLTGLSGMCTEQCKRDVECDRMDKCCSNGCGTTCHSPTKTDVFPPKPGKLEFKVLRDGGVLVKWGKRPNGTYIKPVIYVLRWWCESRPGTKVMATTHLRRKVKGLRPGDACKFIVAATNVHGSLGFSDPQVYRKKFLRPSPPTRLEVVKNKPRGKKVDLVIRWEPPRFLDGLPLVRYLILWSDGLDGVSPEYHRLRMNKKTVRAARTRATIPGLNPGTIYFIQVKAVIKWSGRNVNGRPASKHTKTDSPPILDVKSNVEKYMLYWTPHVCGGVAQHTKTLVMEATTHKQEFVLYNLKSDCVYELKLYTVNHYREKDSGSIHRFQTPLCHETKGHKDAKCPPKVSPPKPPGNLYVRFKLSASCMCQAVVSWDWPSHEKHPHQFSVSWGPSREPGESPMGPIIYQKDPYRIHIPGNDKEACVTYLEPLRHYTVQVTSHAHKLKSSPAVKHFSTPFNMAKCNISPPVDQDFGDIDLTMSDESKEDKRLAVRDPTSSPGGGVPSDKPSLLIALTLPAAVFTIMKALL